ncbi:MAG: class I SAM-dependent methyltransferase, partial [Flavobacteriaceae bacterium]
PDILPYLWQKSDNILIKTSPLIDLSSGLKTLRSVKEVHIVAVRNEVKELLWVLEKNFSGEASITTINIIKGKDQLMSFLWLEEKSVICDFGSCGEYLYEPNAAIMKSGAFKLIAQRYGLRKLHEHSHLYTSDTLKEFPGKRFQLETSFKYSRKNIKRSGIQKANITTRNFPYSVAELRKKHRIADGGDQTLFFTTDHMGDFVVLLCRLIATEL